MIDREARVFRRMIVLLAAAGASLPLSVAAQSVKVGLINSYTGFVAQPADQGQKGFDLYVKEHEKDLPPGVKIELLRRDDTSNPEVGKRLAQELITRDRVQLLTGIVLSPVATAVAPLTAEANFPPFVQRIKDAKPDVVFIFVPAGTQATGMMKAIKDLGLREAGINVTAPQDLLPDEELPRMGDTPLGLITSGTYSADAKRPANE